MMGQIISDKVTAQEAIAELTGVDVSKDANDNYTLNFSTVPSMISAETLGNQLLDDISQFVSCILAQANKFPQIAKLLEEQDSQVAGGIRGQK